MLHARAAREDWYTARIVAMVAAVNSKQHKYTPKKYMLPTHAKADAPREREPMTGDQVMDAFKRMGYPVIDLTNEVIN